MCLLVTQRNAQLLIYFDAFLSLIMCVGRARITRCQTQRVFSFLFLLKVDFSSFYFVIWCERLRSTKVLLAVSSSKPHTTDGARSYRQELTNGGALKLDLTCLTHSQWHNYSMFYDKLLVFIIIIIIVLLKKKREKYEEFLARERITQTSCAH